MDVTKDATTAALHQETQRIKALLSLAETALDAAQRASAEPPPPLAAVIDAGKLETARLTDLTGTTAGEVNRLKALQASQATALTEWQTRAAQAAEDCKRHTAAAAFYRDSLAECRRLERVAFSMAAEKLVKPAEDAYIEAAQALKKALTDITAVKAVQVCASFSENRTNDPHFYPHINVSLFITEQVSIPRASVLGGELSRAQAGEASYGEAVIGKEALRQLASLEANRIVDVMKGRT